MKNIIDYVVDTSALGFTEKPFCEADSLILSQLSYLDYQDVLVRTGLGKSQADLARAIKLRGIRTLSKDTSTPEKNEKLLFAVLESRRFGQIRASSFVNEIDADAQKQFSAVTFTLLPDVSYVAFRGTDMTLVGWKEDFNMAYAFPVPAQERAVEYLDKVARTVKGQLLVGGHSKGGNLAIYSAVKCQKSVRDRIAAVYCHDGPGFKEDIYSDARYKEIARSIHTTIPTHSVIGLLLQNDDNYRVVDSSSVGLLQHDPFTWKIKNGDLQFTKRLARDSAILDRTLDQWLDGLDDEKRKRFVDTLFEVLGASEIGTLQELKANWRKAAGDTLTVMKETDADTRRFILNILGLFAKVASSNLQEDLKQRIASLLPKREA